MLLLSIEIDLCLPSTIYRSVGGKRRFNFNRTTILLSSVDWSSVLISPPYDSLSLGRILVGIYDVLLKCFRECIPLVNSRLKRSGRQWYSARLSKLRKRKSKLFKKFLDQVLIMIMLFTLGRVWIIVK